MVTIEDIKWGYPEDVRNKAKNAKIELKKINPHLENIVLSFMDGAEEMVRCEKVFRKSRRAVLLKNPNISKAMVDFEKKHHEKSIQHLEKALSHFKSFKEKFDPKLKEKINKNLKDKEHLKKLKEEMKKPIDELLLDTDFNEAEIKEFMDIYNEELLEFEKNDVDGNIDRFESKLKELAKLRSDEEKNRGREHRSPIAWWKYFVLVGAFIAVVYTFQLAFGITVLSSGALTGAIAIAVGISVFIVAQMIIIFLQGC
jgi:hypothetical protein